MTTREQQLTDIDFSELSPRVLNALVNLAAMEANPATRVGRADTVLYILRRQAAARAAGSRAPEADADPEEES